MSAYQCSLKYRLSSENIAFGRVIGQEKCGDNPDEALAQHLYQMGKRDQRHSLANSFLSLLHDALDGSLKDIT